MKTGYHAIYDQDYFEAIDYAGKNNFDFVQFDLGVPKFFLDSLSDKAPLTSSFFESLFFKMMYI
jgi:hypothetical protein